jgi:trehalose/maltose transport system substrate-binding protein
MRRQIFISYRHGDSVGFTGRLYDRLRHHFPKAKIFLDVNAIELGTDFEKAIEENVGSCDVLIAMIGRRWLTSTDEQGRRRLDDPKDFVRREIATALGRGIRVIPVLVDGALMPHSDGLPDDLKALVRRQALTVSYEHFDADSKRLIDAVEWIFQVEPEPRPWPWWLALQKAWNIAAAILTSAPKEVWIFAFAIFAFAIVSVALGLWIISSPPQPRPTPSSVIIRLAVDKSQKQGGQWTRDRARDWAQTHNTAVEYIDRPDDSSATLEEFQRYWAAQSADADVYMIDVTWPAIAAPYAVDLKQYFTADEINEHFPRIIQNNTVNGKLVGMPFFMDVGVLYYRTDLLSEYRLGDWPKTWEELASMAQTIQDGERERGNPKFQGFVFEGKASESLTCNALEWFYSFGGGAVVDPDRNVTMEAREAAEKALKTAHGWIGFISPEAVTTYGEDEANNLWEAGNAAFMRNWPNYAGVSGRNPNSRIFNKFAVTVLPRSGARGQHAAALGGWQLMVSAYSKNKDLAADLVRYLCSRDIQKRRAIEQLQLPTRPDLYEDQKVLESFPWFTDILKVLENAVARPSKVARTSSYDQLSSVIFQNVNQVLSGKESEKDAVAKIIQAVHQTR